MNEIHTNQPLITSFYIKFRSLKKETLHNHFTPCHHKSFMAKDFSQERAFDTKSYTYSDNLYKISRFLTG